jgi:hypothetical protein
MAFASVLTTDGTAIRFAPSAACVLCNFGIADGTICVNRYQFAMSQGPLCLDFVAKVPKGTAADFPPRRETSEDVRPMQPQSRCRNRL